MKTPPTKYRRDDSPYIYVRITLPGGRRVRRSTGLRHDDAFEEWLRLWDRHLARELNDGKLHLS